MGIRKGDSMEKAHILQEIRRTAEANGGAPLGVDRFEKATGIGVSEWKGKYWARWGDAQNEAGLPANAFGSKPYDERKLLEKFAQLARDLGRVPTKQDVRLKRHHDPSFPSYTAFSRRWRQGVLVARVLEFCRDDGRWDDVLRMCEQYVPPLEPAAQEPLDKSRDRVEHDGFVYLIKSGKFYKIGKTNAVGRREYELSIQLPEKAKRIHVIRTDDPTGIEEYWHKRFAEKRANGEWFALDAADVAAFKRRKFM